MSCEFRSSIFQLVLNRTNLLYSLPRFPSSSQSTTFFLLSSFSKQPLILSTHTHVYTTYIGTTSRSLPNAMSKLVFVVIFIQLRSHLPLIFSVPCTYLVIIIIIRHKTERKKAQDEEVTVSLPAIFSLYFLKMPHGKIWKKKSSCDR